MSVRRRASARAPSGPAAFATRVIHAGQQADPITGAVIPPIYQTSTYIRPGLGEGWPYTYARTVNPTRSSLERNVANLEGGLEARCFASGMSAIAAVLHLLGTGDHVVASRNIYGGTYRLFEGLLRGLGIDFTWVDTADLRATDAAVTPKTRMLFVETPANPVLTLTDIAGAAGLARRRGLLLVVDNTFMSPCFQQPIALGAHLVVHSTTKYLNGHSDSVGGCVVSARKKEAARIAYVQNAMGAILSPFESFLVLRGIKTLALRMARHEENARRLATWLERHPAIRRVHYPGLRSHPQRALARRQMTGFGGMISIDLGSLGAVKRFVRRLRLCSLAESLGGVETLVSHPATMTHGSLPAAERRRAGVTDGLVRISVGVEDARDIEADLDRALG